jgi:hypothetical protein
MLIELRVEQNGKTIFRAECDTERGGSFAQFSKSALTKFKQSTQKSHCSKNVWLKFDVVR